MRKSGLYVAIGDSITWTIAAELYPTKIRKSIHRDVMPIQHVNKGNGGSKTSDWIYMLPQQVLHLPIGLITIGLGMNDSANDQVGVTNYGNNLSTMIDLIRQHSPNADIILCAPSSTTDSTRTPYIQNYRNQMQTTATQKGTYFCDFSQAYTTGQVATYTADGIHPDVNGHQLIANLLYPIVQQTNFYKNLGK